MNEEEKILVGHYRLPDGYTIVEEKILPAGHYRLPDGYTIVRHKSSIEVREKKPSHTTGPMCKDCKHYGRGFDKHFRRYRETTVCLIHPLGERDRGYYLHVGAIKRACDKFERREDEV